MAPTNNPGFSSGRTVKAGKLHYIPRQADEELLQLCLSSTPACILHAPQMGKSSLLAKTAERLSERSHQTILIDFSQFPIPPHEEEWFQKILVLLEDGLDLSTDALPWWTTHQSLAPPERLLQFFQEVVLPETQRPLTLFLDEIEQTLENGFGFSIFRWLDLMHGMRKTDPDFARFSFVLCGVTRPERLIPEGSPTPFSYCTEVRLSDFTLEETKPLAAGLSLPSALAQDVLGWIFEWTQGHPYLTQLCCRVIEEQHRSTWSAPEVDECLRYFLASPQGQQDRNFQLVRSALTEADSTGQVLLPTYLKVLEGQNLRTQYDQASIDQLHLSGVIRELDGHLVIRNQIYAELFTPSWAKRHLPSPDSPHHRTYFIAASLALLGMGFLFWQFHADSPPSPLAHTSPSSPTAIALSPVPPKAGTPTGQTTQKIQELESTIERYQQLGHEEVEALKKQRTRLENQLSQSQDNQENARQQIAELKNALTDTQNLLQQERTAFQQDQAQHQKETKDLTENLESAKEELTVLQQALLARSSLTPSETKQLLSDRTHLEERLQTTTRRLKESHSTIQNLETRLAQQQQTAESASLRAQQDHTRITEKLQLLQTELITAKDQVATTERQANEHRQLAQQELRRLQREREDLVQELASSQQSLQELQSSLTTQTQALHEADQEHNSLMTKIQQLQDQHNQADTLIQQLQASAYEDRQSLEKAREQQRSLTTQLEILRAEKTDTDSQLAELKTRVDESLLASQQAERTASSLSDQIRVLENEKAQALDRVAQLQRELSEQQEATQQMVQSLKTQLTQKETQVADQQAAIQSIHTSSSERVQRTENDLTALTKVQTQLEQRLQEKEQALTQAQTRITQLEAESTRLASLRQDLAHLTQTNERLKGELNQTEQALQLLQEASKAQASSLSSPPITKSPLTGMNHKSEPFQTVKKLLPVLTSQAVQPTHQANNGSARLLWARQAYLFSRHYNGMGWASIDQALRTALHASPIRLKVPKGRINDLTFDKSGRHLLGGNSTGQLLVWDLEHPSKPPRTLSGHTAPILNISKSPNGLLLASGSQDSTIRLWNMSNLSAPPKILQGHIKGITSLAFSPDDKTLASGSQDHTIRLWDLSQASPTNRTVGSHAGWVNSMVFSPDSRFLISAGNDLTIQMWNLTRPGTPPQILRGHTQSITNLALHPSGSMLASASRGTQIALWNLRATNPTPNFLTGHTSRVSHVAFSPDGHTLLSVGLDETTRLWNWQKTTEPPVVLPSKQGSLRSIAMTPDGLTFAVGGTGREVVLWASTDNLAHAVCDTVDQNLSFQEWQELVGPHLPYERTCPNLPLHPTFIEEGKRLVREGKPKQAKLIFQRAKELDPFLEFDPQQEVERLSAKSS